MPSLENFREFPIDLATKIKKRAAVTLWYQTSVVDIHIFYTDFGVGSVPRPHLHRHNYRSIRAWRPSVPRLSPSPPYLVLFRT